MLIVNRATISCRPTDASQRATATRFRTPSRRNRSAAPCRSPLPGAQHPDTRGEFKRPNNRLASALLAATALASCGGGDGGGGSAPPTAVAPTPTPSPTPAPSPTPTPTPGSFPVTADLQFSTRFTRLSYTGTPGENPLTGLESDGVFPGGSFTTSPDLTNGTLRIEDNYLTRATFAASQRQGEDTRNAVIYTYAGADGAAIPAGRSVGEVAGMMDRQR